jgi:predicted transcriptional regulator
MADNSIVSISLAVTLRDRLDREAERRQRSRSFLVSEAIRAYLDRAVQQDFDEARERTLRDGLDLSPAARLRQSEELWSELARGRTVSVPWTAAFDTFEEYERWRRGGAPPA